MTNSEPEQRRVLLVAPHPFFEERGSPIAVRLLAEALCDRGHLVDLLTFPGGSAVEIPGLTIRRLPLIPGVNNVPVGLSWKKLVYDTLLCGYIFGLAIGRRYDVIHAVEEAIFPSLLAGKLTRTFVVYDMDSSMADQMISSSRWFEPAGRILYGLERWAIRKANAIFAVCEDLAARAREIRPGDKMIFVIEDAPLPAESDGSSADDIRGLASGRDLLALYVGNLEPYQGIDLMLEGLAKADVTRLGLVVIGGSDARIEHYRDLAVRLQIGDNVYFLGPRPLNHLHSYLDQADILVSPRISGINTPMKIYSYMAAGRAILATKIRSHTQVLDEKTAMLVEPNPAGFSEGLRCLANDATLRASLGTASARCANESYSIDAFRRKVATAYDSVLRRRVTAVDASTRFFSVNR